MRPRSRASCCWARGPTGCCQLRWCKKYQGCRKHIPRVLIHYNSSAITHSLTHSVVGKCMASYMNGCVNAGVVSVVIYLYYIKVYGPLPATYIIPILLSLTCTGLFLAAAIYDLQVDGTSLPLFFCSFIGGVVGCTASVIMPQFLMKYQSICISACRTGGSAMILLCALIAAIQQPGASTPNFSVPVYYTIFAFIMILPMPAYYYIIKNGLGLRAVENNKDMELDAIDNGIHLHTTTLPS